MHHDLYSLSDYEESLLVKKYTSIGKHVPQMVTKSWLLMNLDETEKSNTW